MEIKNKVAENNAQSLYSTYTNEIFWNDSWEHLMFYYFFVKNCPWYLTLQFGIVSRRELNPSQVKGFHDRKYLEFILYYLSEIKNYQPNLKFVFCLLFVNSKKETNWHLKVLIDNEQVDYCLSFYSCLSVCLCVCLCVCASKWMCVFC